MAKKQQHFLFELWGKADKDSFKIFSKNLNERQTRFDKAVKQRTLEIWQSFTVQMRRIILEEEQRLKTIDVLKNSSRGCRSTMEKEVLRRFIVAKLTCIPKSISFSEMDQLCNELDWYPLIGRSILFLQGDFGNVYYMIAKGRVGLFLEPSKDREMVIAREFGSLRGQPFVGADEDLDRMGNRIFNLNVQPPPSPSLPFLLLLLTHTVQAGAGFGEYAILASTNKIRSCAAVAIDDDCMLLVMHADTYNAVLRQHHYRQKQLSSATALLQELPLFRHHTYSKIASVAYTMRSQSYSSQSVLVKMGDAINNVLLIASGQVKVYAPPGQSVLAAEEDGMDKNVLKRLPRLAVAMLGRGQIIGEIELHKGSRTFLMTYETASASTEVLEMPATVFKEALDSGDFKRSMVYKSIESAVEEKEQRRAGRITRAYEAMTKMVEGRSKALKSKEEIMNILPSLLDHEPLANSPRKDFSKKKTIALPTSPEPETTAIPPSLRKASSIRSPRKLSFVAH